MYVAIIETHQNVKEFPDNLPKRCVEFATEAEAKSAYPDALIMSVDEYKNHCARFQVRLPKEKAARKLQSVSLSAKHYLQMLGISLSSSVLVLALLKHLHLLR